MALSKRIKIGLGIIAIVGLAGIAGNDDYAEEQLALERYCQKVYDGKWPDFNENYNALCEADRLRRR